MERPRTPPQQWFTSPVQTPQGSPSKKQAPPGAHMLSDIFESALKLSPIAALSPNKAGRASQVSPVLSPRSSHLSSVEESGASVDTSVVHKDGYPFPASPKKSNKENTPPGPKQGKEVSYPQSPAAASRQEFYQSRQQGPVAGRKTFETQRGLSAEELEKLQNPKVKRLANVTQLCQSSPISNDMNRSMLMHGRLPRPLLRPAQLSSCSTAAARAVPSSGPCSSCDPGRGVRTSMAQVSRPGESPFAQTPDTPASGRLPDPDAGRPGRLRTGVFGSEERYA